MQRLLLHAIMQTVSKRGLVLKTMPEECIMTKDSPIGVFDSGVGGISVLRVMQETMPHENFIYYGDSGNAPYGEKTPDHIRRLSENVIRFLFHKEVKAVVIACNTATSAAADYLRAKYPDRIILGMEPAVKPAVLKSGKRHPAVLVMATSSTLHGERMKHLVSLHGEDGDIYPLAAPGIVRLVEAGKKDSPEMLEYLSEILSPYRKHANGSIGTHIDSLVLGCTHFPFVEEHIKEVLGYPVEVYNGAYGTAREALRRLTEAGLLSDRAAPGDVKLYSSSTTPDPTALERMLLLS